MSKPLNKLTLKDMTKDELIEYINRSQFVPNKILLATIRHERQVAQLKKKNDEAMRRLEKTKGGPSLEDLRKYLDAVDAHTKVSDELMKVSRTGHDQIMQMYAEVEKRR